MVKATFDIRSIEIPPVAVKPLYAGVGASDIAYTAVKEYVSDAQKRINDVQKRVRDFDPKSLRKQATEAAEARVAELQAVPTRVQTAVESNVSTVVETYGDLAKRGETLVTRFRSGQPAVDLEVKSTQTKVVSVKASAGTTTAPAKKTTAKKTPAKKAPAKKAPAKKAPAQKTTTVKQTTVKTAPESPVKATVTTETTD